MMVFPIQFAHLPRVRLVKDGTLSAQWVVEIGDVRAFSLAQDRISAIRSDGILFAKAGSLAAQWVQGAGEVLSQQIAGGRLAAKLPNGLYVKSGSLMAEWVYMSGSPRAFQLEYYVVDRKNDRDVGYARAGRDKDNREVFRSRDGDAFREPAGGFGGALVDAVVEHLATLRKRCPNVMRWRKWRLTKPRMPPKERRTNQRTRRNANEHGRLSSLRLGRYNVELLQHAGSK